MSRECFPTSALVELQGNLGLRFISRKSKYAEYWILGFKNHILVNDYRDSGLQAIDYVLEKNDATNFALDFNGTANVSIMSVPEKDLITIKLENSLNTNPQKKLWIVTGLADRIPFYPYEYTLINRMKNGEYALIALYSLNSKSSLLETSPVSFEILE